MQTISALKARARLGTILDEVSQNGEHYIIERLNRPLVAILPIKEYRTHFNQDVSEKDKTELLQALASLRKKYSKKLSGRINSLDLIHKMRDERTQHLLKLSR